jgi:hypothetical protein
MKGRCSQKKTDKIEKNTKAPSTKPIVFAPLVVGSKSTHANYGPCGT